MKKSKSAKRSKSRPKKSKLAEIKADFDVIFSCVVRMKCANSIGSVSCVTCGTSMHWRALHNGHFMKRSTHPHLLHVIDNCWPQCWRCNIALDGNYILYTRFMQKRFGVEKVDDMIYGKSLEKATSADYEDMFARYIPVFLSELKRTGSSAKPSELAIVEKYKHL